MSLNLGTLTDVQIALEINIRLNEIGMLNGEAIRRVLQSQK